MSHQCACGEPIADTAVIGGKCVDRLEQNLAEIPAIDRELDLTLSRQTASGQRHGGRSAEKPLPYDVGASEAQGNLRAVLVGWVRVLDLGERLPGDTIEAMSVWLLARIVRIAHHEAGGEIADEIEAATRVGRRAFARSAPERLYAGRCGAVVPGLDSECSEGLYARPGAAQVACRLCGTQHDVDERRTWMLEAAEEMLLTSGEIARALPKLLGVEVTKGRVQKWAQRHRIVAHGLTLEGWPLYRVGDVRALIENEAKVRAA